MANKSNKDTSTELVVAQQTEMPSYLEKYKETPTGLESLRKYFVPPRAKIVQAQSGEAFTDFGIGSVVMIPQMLRVAEAEEKFYLTPIFQFTEYCTWNPYALKASLPVIRERSTDPESEIAKKARSKETWNEVCPEAPKARQNDAAMMLRHCEHINFLCVLAVSPDHTLYQVPFTISFHHSGFRAGQNLASLLLMKKAPIYAGVYQANSEPMKNDLGNWMGWKIQNPSAGSGVNPWVPEETFLVYKNLFERFADLREKDEIRPDYDDEAQAETVADSSGKF